MLDRTSLYGCLALHTLASTDDGSGRFIAIAEVSRRTAIPRPYLAKVCGALERCGLIETRRGTGGGARLTPAGGTASIRTVAEALCGGPRWQRCCHGHDLEAGHDCPACRAWSAIGTQVGTILDGIRLGRREVARLSTGDEASSGE